MIVLNPGLTLKGYMGDHARVRTLKATISNLDLIILGYNVRLKQHLT